MQQYNQLNMDMFHSIGFALSACAEKAFISCPPGQTAIDENDLEFELRRDNGIDEYISPAAETSLSSGDKIWVKYRPGGVTAILHDVKCFEADWYDTLKASLMFEFNGFKTKENLLMVEWFQQMQAWSEDIGVNDDVHVDGYDTIRISASLGGENKKVKDFDFVGCAVGNAPIGLGPKELRLSP